MNRDLLKIFCWLMVLIIFITGCTRSLTSSENLPLPLPAATIAASPTTTTPPLPTNTPLPPTPIPAARIESGDKALFEGDWERAAQEFQTAYTGSSDRELQSAALLGLGRTHLLAGDYPTAVETLDTVIQNFSETPQASQAHFFLAQAYSQQGNHPAAVESYSEYLHLNPGKIDSYIYNLRGDSRVSAGDYRSAGEDFAAALASPSILDSTFLHLKQARSLTLAGDYTAALDLYNQIYNQTGDDYTKALIDLRVGQIYLDQGLTDQAYTAFLDAVNNYPTSYDSYSALLALVDAGIPVNELNRGLVDYYAGEYGVALAAFNRYLINNPADPATAHYYSGLANRALGGHTEAIDSWNKIIRDYPAHPLWDKAWEQKAYTQWYYLDQYTEAMDTLTSFVNQNPTHARAGEFLYDAAAVAERAGELTLASETWEKVINLYPEYELAVRALFLSGISRYRLEDFSGAYLAFQRFFGLATSPSDRAMAHLWIGKTQEKLGDQAAARSSWDLAANLDPTGYYSERAYDLINNRQAFNPPLEYDLAFDSKKELAEAETWLRDTFDVPPDVDLSGIGDLQYHPNLVRGTELWALGLYDDARVEFEALRQEMMNDPAQTYRLANYFAKIGLYRSSTLAARQVLNLAGMDDAATMNAPKLFNRLRFGVHFDDLIIPLAQKYNFHPIFIFSLIRQESLFESFVRSSASARGLMQIMPATGKEIVRNLGWPSGYSDADLNRPIINLRLGLDYLDKQRATFDGEMYAALAAYNGGPGNALEWKKLAEGDPDLFLEVIRYSETRDYIRRIYEIYNIYRRMYTHTP